MNTGLFTICITVRLLFAYIASVANRRWLSILGYVAILPALGFLYLFVTGVRNKTGAFGEKIWWNHLRPVHFSMDCSLTLLSQEIETHGSCYSWMHWLDWVDLSHIIIYRGVLSMRCCVFANKGCRIPSIS